MPVAFSSMAAISPAFSGSSSVAARCCCMPKASAVSSSWNCAASDFFPFSFGSYSFSQADIHTASTLPLNFWKTSAARLKPTMWS